MIIHHDRLPTCARGKAAARGFTLVELLVVIAIIGVLASLLTPVLMKVRRDALKVDCANNLAQIAKACTMYSDQYHMYPWPKPLNQGGGTQPDLADDNDCRTALGLLTRFGFLDEPKVFLCKAAIDTPADPLDTDAERRTSFVLEEFNCSFTYRKKLTTANVDSRAPLAADKRGGDAAQTPNHPDGRNVVFVGSNVMWFPNEKIDNASDREARRVRQELIGIQ
jgi:prepilin-type N-terminal cleavage/methylation domain-containing protein